MAYLKTEDIELIIYSEELDVLQQADETKFKKADAITVDYFKGYLRNRYDVDTLFTEWDEESEEDDTRPAALVNKMSNYLLSLLYQTQPDRMIPEHRIDETDRVIDWLEKINKGTIIPGFPTVDTEKETDIHSPFKFMSNRKISSNW